MATRLPGKNTSKGALPFQMDYPGPRTRSSTAAVGGVHSDVQPNVLASPQLSRSGGSTASTSALRASITRGQQHRPVSETLHTSTQAPYRPPAPAPAPAPSPSPTPAPYYRPASEPLHSSPQTYRPPSPAPALSPSPAPAPYYRPASEPLHTSPQAPYRPPAPAPYYRPLSEPLHTSPQAPYLPPAPAPAPYYPPVSVTQHTTTHGLHPPPTQSPRYPPWVNAGHSHPQASSPTQLPPSSTVAVESPHSAQASTSSTEWPDDQLPPRQKKRGRGFGAPKPLTQGSRHHIKVTDKGEFSRKDVVRTISSNMKTYLQEVKLTYREWSIEHKKQAYKEFMNVFIWDEEYHDRVVWLYNRKCRQQFSHELSSAKNHHYMGLADPEYKAQHFVWIPPCLIPGYEVLWQTAPVREKSEKAKSNRGKNKTYGGGSISIEGHREKLNTTPDKILFQGAYKATRYRRDKLDGEMKWINEQSAAQYNGYYAKYPEKHGENRDLWPDWDPEMWGDVAKEHHEYRVSGVPSCSRPDLYEMREPTAKGDMPTSFQTSVRTQQLEDEVVALKDKVQAIEASNQETQAQLKSLIAELRPQPEQTQSRNQRGPQSMEAQTFSSQPLEDTGYRPESLAEQAARAARAVCQEDVTRSTEQMSRAPGGHNAQWSNVMDLEGFLQS